MLHFLSFSLLISLLLLSSATLAVERVYFIAADDVEWNYAPGGINEIYGATPSSAASHDIHSSDLDEANSEFWVAQGDNRYTT